MVVNLQIIFYVSSKERYRYSTDRTLIILYTTSLHTYRLLRKLGSVILPHPTKLTGICNRLQTD